MKKSNNRHPVKKWSITFPQCGDLDRKEFAESFPPSEACACAREEHKEGGWHLHLGLELKKAISFANMLKWIKSKYPDDWKRIDLQATKSMISWEEYLSKEDPDVYLKKRVGDREKYLAKLEVRKDEFAKAVGYPSMNALDDHLNEQEIKKQLEYIAHHERYIVFYKEHGPPGAVVHHEQMLTKMQLELKQMLGLSEM